VSAVTPLYSIDQAKAQLAALRPALDEIIELRADTAELQMALRGGPSTTLGGLPEFKAAQARLDELISALTDGEVQVKGIAPLLLDFPAELDGEAVLLCWLEGDPELGWYHRADLGFLGRRPLPG